MPAENVPAVQIALGLLNQPETEPVEIVEEQAVSAALSMLSEGIDAPRPILDVADGDRPVLAVAQPSRSGSDVAPERIDALVAELELEPHDRATIRALLQQGLSEDQVRELAAALLDSVENDADLALALFRAFADRLGYNTVPGVRPRVDGVAATLLGEIAGQTAVELRRVMPEAAAAELAAVTAWPLMSMSAEDIVSAPTSMAEMLLTSRDAGPARVTALALAGPKWFATHLAREDQVRARVAAGELVESLLGKLPAHERGFCEGAALAVAHRFGAESARALLSAYVQVVGDAAGLVLATAMAELNARDDLRAAHRQEDALEFLAHTVVELDRQLEHAGEIIGPGGATPRARTHLASHAAEQLIASGSTQAFLIVLKLLQRNTRLSPRERIRRLAQLPRSLSATSDPDALERWVMATPSRRSV